METLFSELLCKIVCGAQFLSWGHSSGSVAIFLAAALVWIISPKSSSSNNFSLGEKIEFKNIKVRGLLNEYNLMFYCFVIVILSQLLIILLKAWSCLLWKDHFTLNIE